MSTVQKPKNKKVSLKAIKKVLASCAFDPKVPGPMKIIMDSGNKEYFLMRAVECIHEAKLGIGKDKIRQAISLLALCLIEDEVKPEQND